MKKVNVRCWEMKVRCMCGDIESVWVTSIGIFGGYDLYTCKICGEIFAVDTGLELYAKPPLSEKIKSIKCPTCDSNLGKTLMKYPKNFKCKKTGNIYNFDRPSLMPPDDDSIIKEFYSIL